MAELNNVVILSCFVIFAMIGVVIPKSYPHARIARCQCKLMAASSSAGASTDKLLYDFGTIKEFKNEPGINCKAARSECRVACDELARTHFSVPKKSTGNAIYRAANSKSTVGFQACTAYGQVTSGLGMRTKSQALHCAKHEKLGYWKHKLCCGHTTVPLSENRVLEAFGWNPDCEATLFSLS